MVVGRDDARALPRLAERRHVGREDRELASYAAEAAVDVPRVRASGVEPAAQLRNAAPEKAEDREQHRAVALDALPASLVCVYLVLVEMAVAGEQGVGNVADYPVQRGDGGDIDAGRGHALVEADALAVADKPRERHFPKSSALSAEAEAHIVAQGRDVHVGPAAVIVRHGVRFKRRGVAEVLRRFVGRRGLNGVSAAFAEFRDARVYGQRLFWVRPRLSERARRKPRVAGA